MNTTKQTFTAREWLERTLPHRAVWMSEIDGTVWIIGVEDHAGYYDARGRLTLPNSGNNQVSLIEDGLIHITRTTAIDLMVKAIEDDHIPDSGGMVAGDGSEVRIIDGSFAPNRDEVAEANPVIVDDNDGQPMVADPQPASTPAFKVGDRVQVIYSPIKERIGQVFAIGMIDQHGRCWRIEYADNWCLMPEHLHPATTEQKPEAARFGGPHDKEAIAWAKDRGYEVAGWAVPSNGEQYIANSNKPSDIKGAWAWGLLTQGTGVWLGNGLRYILHLKEPAKVDTLTKLAEVLRDALGEQWHLCRTVADAIDAHIQAILKDAKQ